MDGRTGIFIALFGTTSHFVYCWIASLRQDSVQPVAHSRRELAPVPSLFHLLTGFVTNFFDTLGIGSFATTTTIFKLGRVLPDELIPGTLNVGHTLPTVLQAFIYISIVQVNLTTLVLLMASSAIGAWWGAGLVSRLPRRVIQLGVGGALAAAVGFMTMRELHLFPAGGEQLALHGVPLLVGILGTALFGALSTLGIGFYAPCMILVSLLGMAPLAAFPIMMGSSAFLMPLASLRFVKSRFYLGRVAVGLALGGLPAVVIAAFIVKSLPLDTLRRLVMAIALWAAFLLFRSAYQERDAPTISTRVTTT
jgi:uncharacterized membrane protein YfcA